MAVGLPPFSQLGDHGRGQGDEAVLAALAATHVQARVIRLRVPQVADLDAHRLADAQAGVIDERERGAVARCAHGAQQGGDLLPREDQRESLGRGNADLLEHGPVGGDAQAVAEEAAQGAAGQLHGRAAEALLLAQEEEVSAELILGQRGGVGPVVFGQLADVADVFVPGGLAVIFELDKVGELCDGGERLSNHGAASVPASAGAGTPPDEKNHRPPEPMSSPGPTARRQARRKAAGFNHALQRL